MKKYLVLFIAVFFVQYALAQDFSNKGKEFWLAYSYHVGMVNTGGAPAMTLYLTCDVATTYNVEIFGGVTIQAGTINANQVIPVTIPNTYFISTNGLSTNKTIHITSVKAIVVYSFITRSQASAASLCLPANVLGKEYYATSFTQNSNEPNSSSFITIVAIEDNTVVEITVTAPTLPTLGGWPAGSTNTINLNKGQIYQVLGTTTGNNGVDLSGSKIKSIASGTGGCKRIAVFSGSGKIAIGAPAVAPANACAGGSADNLYQQLIPVASWGKSFLTVPSFGKPYNYYRVMRSDPTTNLFVNGVLIPAASFTNNYYQFFNNTPNYIEADQPISIAQYFTSQQCPGTAAPGGGNPTPYDPDMIVLSPIEQKISDVTLVSSPLTVGGAHQHNLHIIMKTGGTAQSSFQFDLANVPLTSWVTHPANPAYAYLYLSNITAGNHKLVSDSGFNAIAYGYGNAETYGYNAGTNVRDFNINYIAYSANASPAETTPSVCTASPFKFKMSLPFQPLQLTWGLNAVGALPASAIPNNTPVVQSPDPSCSPPPSPSPLPNYPTAGFVCHDSVTVLNGKPLFWYSLPISYTINASGLYNVPITAVTSNVDGCGTSRDFEFPLGVFDPPVAGFKFNPPGCLADPVQFIDTTISPKPNYKWFWNFDDPGSGVNNTSDLENPTHIFATTGNHNVTLSTITTVGCFSNTSTRQVFVPNLPTATIAGANTLCINTAPTNITFTGNFGLPPYVFSYHINSGPIQSITSIGTTAVLPINTIVAGTFTYYLDSVKNQGSTICKQLQTGNVVVNITPDATLALSSAAATASQTVCINNAITNITYAVGGSGTGGSVSGLPAGVTGTYVAGVITISGTPTVSGTFNYTVSTTGPCIKPQLTGVVNVTADATLTLSSAAATTSQTLCINNPLTNITYAVAASGTGGSVSGLPTGVTGTYAGGVITISGTPTVSGAFNYTITTTGPCVKPTLTGVINVTANATIALSSAPTTNNQTLCINTALTNITYAVGASGTGGTVSGLPTGVTGTYALGIITISGTPSVSGIFNYTVSTTGPCIKPSLSGVINVTSDATLVLSSAPTTNNQTLCINTALTNITYTVGASGTGGSVSGLPAGVTATYTGGIITITGTPTVSGAFNYTVSTTGPCVKPSLLGVINVTPNAIISLSSAVGTNIQNLCINVPITNITYTVGGSGTGGSVSGLPPGITGTYTAGVITISGAPTVTGVFNYTVSTTGPCIKPTANGSITVTPDATITLTSALATTNQQLCKNKPLTNITYQIAAGGTGGTVSGLPAGVIGTYAGGIFTISGTPTVDGLFSYTITTTGTCVQKTATGSILVHPLPTASFITTAPFCALKDLTFTPAPLTGAAVVTSWVWNYDNGAGPQIRTDNNPFTINYATAGVKNVTFKTVSDKGCESVLFTTPVTINVKPKAGFLSPESCLADAFAQFTDSSKPVGTIALWEWNFGDPLSPTNIISGSGPTFQNPQHAYATTGLKTVSLIVTTTSGCKDTVQAQSFFINGEVTSADFITLTSPICSNRPVQIRENSVVNVGGLIRVEIYWDNVAAPTVLETDELPTPGKIYTHVYPNLLVDRTYQVRYIAYTGFDGTCQKEVIKPIVVRASPVATFTTPQDVCLNGGPVELNTGGFTGGTAVYTGPGVTFAGGIYTFNPLATGVVVGATNNVTYTVTSPANCDSALVRQVKVLAPPIVNTFTTVGNKCHNNSITFRNTTSNGDGTIVRWIYNWGDGSLPQTMTTGADVTHVYTTIGVKTATLTLETGFGCRNIPFPLTFTVNPLPTPNYTFTPSACLPSANIVFTNNTPAPLSGYTFNWSFALPSTAAADVSTAPSPSHVYTTQGPFNTHLIATIIATGCKDSTAIIPIGSSTIHPAPVLQFINIPDVCLNNGNKSFLLLASETSGIAGGPGIFSGPGIISANGDFNPLLVGAGTYDITYKWTSTFGCPTTITKQVKVLAAPIVNTFTTVGNVCEQNGIVFRNTKTEGAGNITTWVYDWNDGITQTESNGDDVTHVYSIAGTYTPTLYVITNDGCRSLVKPLTVVVNALPAPNFTFTPVACLPQAKVDFTNTTPPQSTGGLAYQWVFDDVPATVKTTVNTDFTYTSLGSHPVELIATNTTTFCKKSIIKDIQNSLHPAPTASFNFNKPSVCIRDNVTVLDAPSNPADGTMTKWEWNYGDNAAIYTGQIQAPYTYAAAGTYQVKLKVTNSFGCVDDTTRAFTVHPYPVVNAGRDSIILEGGQIVLTPTVTGNDLRYLWTGNPAPLRLSNDTVLNPIASPLADITYLLKVTARGGCSDTNSVFVKVLKFPLIPNTFTPNNDGVHETWVIKYLDSYPDARVQVFTRAGQLVFESRRYVKPWDGTLNGKSLPFDTYYYIIEPGTGRTPITGYITIVK